jgi:hypothetical protein
MEDQAEHQFWTKLEFRVSREMQSEPNCRRLRLWCDGFIPEHYHSDHVPHRITGAAWIGTDSRHQEKWKFSLILPSPASSRADINWAALLPPPKTNGWLVVAPEKKEIEVRLRE